MYVCIFVLWTAAIMRIIFISISFPALAPSSILDEEKYEYMSNVRFSGAKNMIASLRG
jgi:hypothetical protein